MVEIILRFTESLGRNAENYSFINKLEWNNRERSFGPIEKLSFACLRIEWPYQLFQKEIAFIACIRREVFLWMKKFIHF